MAETPKTPKFHPALAITNVKTLIPISLDLESGQYHSWAALFKVQARIHEVLDHIIPPTDAKEKATYAKAKSDDLPFWKRLDAAVLQWIYSTVSSDILTSILIDDDSAEHAWQSVADLFHDNKNSRAMYLHKEFTNTGLANFPTTNAYCNRLADQLTNVGAPVNDHSMVLKMLQGLTEPYSHFVTVMQNKKTLPSFATARSKLALEETTILERAKLESGSAALLVTSQHTGDDYNPSSHSHHNNNRHNNNNRGNKGNNRKVPTKIFGGGGRNSSYGGRNFGKSGSGSGGGQTSGNGRGLQMQWQPNPWMQQWAPWVVPPCPYPSYNWARPPKFSPRPQQQASLLGPRPQQSAFNATTSPTPTDIDAALHTLSLAQPDPSWYMDTGATSHMTSVQGNLSSYLNLSKNHGIIVGNGHSIPIRGFGNANLSPPHPPLVLNNVLHAPNLIKNLVSVRKFTTDNHVSVAFDPFGFSVKDFQTGMTLMRCDSRGELYPITTTTNQAKSPSTFTALSPSIWHDRLGHPGAPVLDSLRRNKLIECTKTTSSFCHSCPLGKHVKLPFIDSHNSTYLPFDILHSDLWTSPILSSLGHKYYVLYLDDYSKFLWTFPISKKSQVFFTFLKFRAYIKTQFERELKNIQCDNGREYDNGPFLRHCEANGIFFRFSCPHTSSQNGKAERKICSINNIIRTCLFTSIVLALCIANGNISS